MSASPIISRSPSPLAEFDYLDMSHILASDAPILSPALDHNAPLPSSYPYALTSPSTTSMDFIASSQYNGSTSDYYVQPQPSSAENMAKMRMNSGFAAPEGACMSTHQVFELDGPTPAAPAPVETRPQPQQPRAKTPVPEPPVATSHKRSASRSLSPAAEFEMMMSGDSGAAPLAPGQKKQRGAVISTKDFIPPDVSGMSKREARLVKNRAAAFLSRQRKREEFECMEIRVAELEKENARLLAIAQGQQPAAPAPSAQDEVEALRAQLAAAHEMIASSTQLHTMPPSPAISTRSLAYPAQSQESSFSASSSSSSREMKMEDNEVVSIPSRGNSKSAAAGLGLMVLLCALPSLLSSMPQTASSAPAAIDIPMSPSWAFSNLPDESSPFEWSSDMTSFSGMGQSVKTLEVEGMDVSFDTVPAEDGKIRVRIHHPSSQLMSSASSPSSSFLSSSPSISFSAPNPKASFSIGSDLANLTPGDPFLGVGLGQMDAFDYTLDAPSYSRMGSPFGSDYGSESGSIGSSSATAAGKRRVRIALRSMPETGGKEGGEWEVEFC